MKSKKFCQVGNHYVDILFHREIKGVRLSACAMHAIKQGIKKKPIAPKPKVGDVINGYLQIRSIAATDSGPIKMVLKPLKSKKDKTLAELLKLAEIVFNKWIKKRDTQTDKTAQCISCQQWFKAKEMDAGHYISKKFSAVRFHEDNLNLQCVNCNRFKYGAQKTYRKNLIEKIGLERVEALEQLSKSNFKWEKESLYELIKKYKA